MATKPSSKTADKAKPASMPAPRADTTLIHQQMPEYLAQTKQGSRGNEQVGVEDIIIPRLEIVQALSPCKKRSDPAYIDDAEDGMLYNNVTRELYGDSVLLMPIYFRKEYLIWKDRTKSGGNDGFRGSFLTPELAAAKVQELDEDDLQVIDTAQQFCMLVHSEGRVEEVVVSMARSKMKVSRRWNSLIRLAGGDRFSRVYKMGTVEEKGRKGEFYNFTVDVYGFPSKKLYELAASKYESISTGRVRADVSGTTYDPDDDHSQDGTRRSGTQDY